MTWRINFCCLKPHLVADYLMHVVHDGVAMTSAILLAVNFLRFLLFLFPAALLLSFLMLGYRSDAFFAELVQSLRYPHRVDSAVELAVLTQLEAVEEQQNLVNGEEVVFLRYRLGEEICLVLVKCGLAVAVCNEVQNLRQEPHGREIIAVGFPQHDQ